jgi:CYTH domain-containing protein
MKGTEQDEIERKFLVSGWDDVETWPVSLEASHIKQLYLKPSEEGRSERVRSRISVNASPGSAPTYTWNAKRFIAPGHYAEEEQEIDQAEYHQAFWKRADPLYQEVEKDRWVFDYEGLTWEMDHYTRGSANGIVILEVELPSLDVNLSLPPFLTIEREVTGIKHWSNRSMAKVGWVPEPRLVAGQVWVRGDASFTVLSTEDGESGLRAETRRWQNEFGNLLGQVQLGVVRVEELLRDGWEIQVERPPRV